MDRIIIRMLQGVASPEEEEWLRRWREEAKENDDRFRQVQRLWELTALVDPRGREEPPRRPEGIVLEAEVGVSSAASKLSSSTSSAEVQVHAGGEPQRTPRVHRSLNRWLGRIGLGAVAASLVALGFGLGGMQETESLPGPIAGSEVVTGAGEMTTVTLVDGSSIRLGPSSRLTLSEDQDGIVAHLRGRAFFAVQANPSRTFRVTTDHGAATVFGTRFEVRTEEEEFRVMVVEGKVRVNSTDGAELFLVESEMSVTGRGAAPAKSTVPDVYEQLTWMGNALVFQRTPLPRVAEEIGRHFNIPVVLEATELAETTVSVTFTDDDLDEVLSVVCEIVGALCLIEDTRVRILTDVPATRVSVI